MCSAAFVSIWAYYLIVLRTDPQTPTKADYVPSLAVLGGRRHGVGRRGTARILRPPRRVVDPGTVDPDARLGRRRGRDRDQLFQAPMGRASSPAPTTQPLPSTVGWKAVAATDADCVVGVDGDALLARAQEHRARRFTSCTASTFSSIERLPVFEGLQRAQPDAARRRRCCACVTIAPQPTVHPDAQNGIQQIDLDIALKAPVTEHPRARPPRSPASITSAPCSSGSRIARRRHHAAPNKAAHCGSSITATTTPRCWRCRSTRSHAAPRLARRRLRPPDRHDGRPRPTATRVPPERRLALARRAARGRGTRLRSRSHDPTCAEALTRCASANWSTPRVPLLGLPTGSAAHVAEHDLAASSARPSTLNDASVSRPAAPTCARSRCPSQAYEPSAPSASVIPRLPHHLRHDSPRIKSRLRPAGDGMAQPADAHVR